MNGWIDEWVDEWVDEWMDVHCIWMNRGWMSG